MKNLIKNSTRNQRWKVCTLLVMLVILAWSLTANTERVPKFSTGGTNLETGFTQVIDGQEIPLDHPWNAQEPGKGEPLTLQIATPDVGGDITLLYYTKDIETQVFLDDTEIYNFEMDETFAFLETPGAKWNSITIPADAGGATLTIVLTSQFANRYAATLTQLYLIHENEVLTVILGHDGFRILMALVLLCMAVMSYTNASIWKRPGQRTFHLYLGNLYLGTALWLSSMCSMLNHFLPIPTFTYLVSMMLAIFLPVLLYEFVSVIYPRKSNMLRSLGFVVWGNFLLQMWLQFILHVSLLDLLPLTYIIYSVGSLVAMGLIVHHICTCKGHIHVPLVSLLIIFCGAIFEVVVLCAFPAHTNLIGVSSVTGLFLYLLVNNLYILYHESRIDVQNIELSRKYQELQNTTLMQQIKAHFFYNTLNTISALCKYDATAADDAILTFAQYMRSYMNLINQHTNIPFEKELEIVEASLKIEKLRFPDAFTYTLHLDYTDFLLPPLSIQPLVENALVHGLRNNGKAGEITLGTSASPAGIQIIITDNGAGFDPSNLDENPSIALNNLKKRLGIMANGHLNIVSALGQGTTVTVTLPPPSPAPHPSNPHKEIL